MATKKKSTKKTASKSTKKTSKKVGKTTVPKHVQDARKAAVTVKAALDKSQTSRQRVAAAKKAAERSKNYAAAGLAAQVTETLLDELKAMDTLWYKTPEAQQAVIIARLSDSVANAMQRAIQVVSALGHKAVICNLFSVTFKDGVRAVITVAPGSALRHDLADHATKDVVLVLADPSVFMQGLSDIKADADQPKLI
jgi:hypothetical protein